MFRNIGGKIKALAVALCIIGMAGSVIGGAYMIYQGTQMTGYMNDAQMPMILGGAAIIVVGCLLSWIGSFFTYGFGQLIEDTAKSAYYSKRASDLLERMNNPASSTYTSQIGSR